MQIEFFKYHGAGNDFIMIDNRKQSISEMLSASIVKSLCDRRTGVGADGLILLDNSKISDFRMIYFNSDGKESSMCGNGGRCIVAFAHRLGIIETHCRFDAIDGVHIGEVLIDGEIKISMTDINSYREIESNIFELNTGSPHYVKFVDLMPDIIINMAQEIRYAPEYKDEGINVNFAYRKDEEIMVRTYERGVEDETLACGTGVTAVAIADAIVHGEYGKLSKRIKAMGGQLEVEFQRNVMNFSNIYLSGPTAEVFNGIINLDI